MPDHIHLLLSIPPKYSISEIMGYLKSKSTLIIFERHANLKYKYGSRKFWCRGYFVDTVGKNEKKIKEYIQNQMQEDLLHDQMSITEYIDPFTESGLTLRLMMRTVVNWQNASMKRDRAKKV